MESHRNAAQYPSSMVDRTSAARKLIRRIGPHGAAVDRVVTVLRASPRR